MDVYLPKGYQQWHGKRKYYCTWTHVGFREHIKTCRLVFPGTKPWNRRTRLTGITTSLEAYQYRELLIDAMLIYLVIVQCVWWRRTANTARTRTVEPLKHASGRRGFHFQECIAFGDGENIYPKQGKLHLNWHHSSVCNIWTKKMIALIERYT